MKRYASVIELSEEHAAEYRCLHAAVWPTVLARITASNIRNYSIFLRRLPDGRLYLFSYFEYVGTDFTADMIALAADPDTQRWWAVCKPCHRPLPDRQADEWWAGMDEVFHCD
jgi:L-rhamnose mutarotase